jgi:hypothetical protein
MSRRDATRFNRNKIKTVRPARRLIYRCDVPVPGPVDLFDGVKRVLVPAPDHTFTRTARTMSNQQQQKIADFLTWFTKNGGTWSDSIRLQHGQFPAHSLLLSTARA